MKIAIVGAGVSGLTAAYLLNREHQIDLYERTEYLGGHANTVSIDAGDREIGLDTGFIVYNEHTYPGFTKLLRDLRVRTKVGDMSLSVSCRACNVEYSSRGLGGWLAQRSQAIRPGRALLTIDILRFYRDTRNAIDKVVSIEMFEAVGAEYFEAYFEAVARALKPGGRFALQTISVPDRSFAGLRDGVNWVQKYIFPGGMLPSIAEIERALKSTELVIDRVEDIGLHYATTLQRWRERFLEQRTAVLALGFDERFIRMWEYYQAASEAGFRSRNTGDLQIALEKPLVRSAGIRHEVPAAFYR